MSLTVFEKISALKAELKKMKLQGKTIGFVPTMGALHAGHLALVKRAKQECDIAVCSIFVNPTQFNNPQDLERYPRTLSTDCDLLNTVACDYVFAPEVAEMYPSTHQMKFNFGDLEQVLEGKFRPGHFNGVGIVVSKLFHIVEPDKAYFGQKDLQQCAVVARLVQELTFPLELIICPTLREADGLAMSSRNKNLSAEERAKAPLIYNIMSQATDMLHNGVSIAHVKDFVAESFKKEPAFNLEYFEMVNRYSLQNIGTLEPDKSALVIAAFLGKTRLIDNFIL